MSKLSFNVTSSHDGGGTEAMVEAIHTLNELDIVDTRASCKRIGYNTYSIVIHFSGNAPELAKAIRNMPKYSTDAIFVSNTNRSLRTKTNR